MKRIRRIVAMTLLLAFALSAAAFAATIVTTGDTNLRKGAGLKYKILKVVPKGITLKTLSTKTDDRDVDWYKVKYKGKTGWISSIFTMDKGDDEAPDNTVWAKKGSTYIRKNAGTGYRSVGVLKKGAYATYLRQKKKDSNGRYWYKIQLGDITGWVSSKYTVLHN